MGWTTRETEALLREAFPWGAHVTVAGGAEFVSIVYEVVECGVDPDGATVRFERDPGDTLQFVTRAELECAATTGLLELSTGARIRQPQVDDISTLASPLRDLIGYQSPSDSPWVARMRLHQSWWRTFRLRVPFGYGPTPKSKKRYGNMLAASAADAGRNFLTPEARNAYDERLARTKVGVDAWRTTRNLLASQPLAFNVFGHLSKHLELATGLFRCLLGEQEVAKVTSIEIERLSDALGDRTAFDAFATYTRPDGHTACIAVETKLTEPFSQQAYDWNHYRRHSAFATDVWATSHVDLLGDPRWSQLWRNHLLARAETSRDPELGPATVLIAYHPSDPHCADNIAGYQALLTRPTCVKGVDLLAIRNALDGLVADDEYQTKWVHDFSARYVDLQLSDALVGLEDLAPAEQ
jgi:hypothetical protein